MYGTPAVEAFAMKDTADMTRDDDALADLQDEGDDGAVEESGGTDVAEADGGPPD